MVEGPKVHLKKERLEKQLRGKVLLHVLPSANLPTSTAFVASSSSASSSVNRKEGSAIQQGLILQDLIVLGKELFLFFSTSSTASLAVDDVTATPHAPSLLLRLHFAMSGTERVVEESLQLAFNGRHHTLAADPKNRKVFSGKVVFQNNTFSANTATVLYLYDSNIRIVSNNPDHIHIKLLPDIYCKQVLDVNNASFSLLRVVDAILHKYDSVLEPSRKRSRSHQTTNSAPLEGPCIQEVLLDQDVLPGVGNVIKCEALFEAQLNPYQPLLSIPIGADEDIHTPKTLVGLLHHVQIFSIAWYEATKKRRDVVKRIYHKQRCELCQQIVKLERSNAGMQRITYYCPHCQIMLGSASQDTPTISSTLVSDAAIVEVEEDWKCDFCGFLNLSMISFCEICSDSKPKVAHAATNNNLPSSSNACLSEINSAVISNNEVKPATSKVATFKTNPTLAVESPVSTIEPIKCQKCQQPAILFRVRKQQSPHVHRLFWGCKYKKCTFFHWADARFPRCPNFNNGVEGKHYTVLRRVLKAGANNGKYFYSCQACSFFQWDADLSSSRNDITSLANAMLDIPL